MDLQRVSQKKISLFMKIKQVIFSLAFLWKLLYIILISIWKMICQIDCTHIKMNNFLLRTWYTAASWWISYLWCRLLDAHRNLSSKGYVSYKTVMNSNQQAFKLQLKYVDAVILMAQTNFILSSILAHIIKVLQVATSNNCILLHLYISMLLFAGI